MKLFLHELRAQIRLYGRSRELAFFTFLLPLILFFLLASSYGDDEIDGIPGHEYLVSGVLGYGVVATTFFGLAIVLVIRRENGILKRLQSTPLPAPTFLVAILSAFLFAFALEGATLYGLAAAAYDVGAPDSPISLVLAMALGGVAFAGLGIGLTGLIRREEGASAVLNAIYLPLLFISGAFFSKESFPGFVQAVADLLPLTYFIELIVAVTARGQEIWDRPTDVAVVAAWGLAGALLAVRTFRWTPYED
jgi:ABC-2 type transport system permease protein